MRKNMFYRSVILTMICVCSLNMQAFAQNMSAMDIIKKAEDKMTGKSSQGEMTMTVVRPGWSRTISMKSWTFGTDYSLFLITWPAKEKGQVFMKRKTEMWNWVPSIERMIKIPPSMMMQSWMGSDFTNDDLIKESSMVKDYTHTIVGSVTIRDYECYKIRMVPKPEAPVVWGKIIVFVSKQGYNYIKGEYYDEDGYLVNTMNFSNIRKMDDRVIPTKMEIIPAEKKGQKTVLEFTKMNFHVKLSESFFSQQKMKTIR